MAFRRINFIYASGICEFVADSVDDIAHLPSQCAMGSSCYVINSSAKFVKNSLGKWILQSISSNNNGSSSSSSSSATFQNMIVNELPAVGQTGVLYLVPNTSASDANNTYIEYLYINDHWEQLGTIDSDLTPITTDSIDAYFES